MEKGIVCSVCKKPLVPYHKDKRMGYCEECKVCRCGWCGDTIMVGHTYYRVDSIWDWFVPKKIMESLFYAPMASCWKCNRAYHLKRSVTKYLFWETKVLYWKIQKFFKKIFRDIKTGRLVTDSE